MKLIERYIYRELFYNLILGVLTINTLIMVEKLIRVSKTLSGIAGIKDMGRIILLIQPQMLLITIPVAFLVSVLLTYGRLNMDNELLAMKASGVGFKRLSMLSLKAGIVLLIVSLFVSTVVAPLGNKRVRKEINGLLRYAIEKKIEDGTFTDIGSMVIYAGTRDKKGIRDIFVYDKKKKAVITAGYASIRHVEEGIAMEFRDGLINIAIEEKNTVIYFSAYSLKAPLNLQFLSRKAGEFMPHELLRKSKRTEPRKALSYLMEFYRRLTYPCLNIVMALIGPGLALLAGKTGRSGGLVMGIIFFTGYYILSMSFEGFVESGRLSPETGMTLPLIVGLLTGIIVFTRSAEG